MYWKKRKGSTLDILILLALFSLAALVVYRLTVSLNYRWQWEIIPSYIFRFDAEKGAWVPNLLLQGLLVTIRLSIWSTLLAMVLGLVMGLMRTAKRLVFRMAAGWYVELVRNTPPLVLVFLFYFFVSAHLLPLLGIEEYLRSCPMFIRTLSELFFSGPQHVIAFVSGILTIALFQGAYITEIIRAGVESVEKGQWEAATALGLSRYQQMIWIVLPQALRRVLPALANEFINTIKYSSIVSIISIQELTFQGMQIMASTNVTIEIWVVVSLIYLLLCLALSQVSRLLENRFMRLQ